MFPAPAPVFDWSQLLSAFRWDHAEGDVFVEKFSKQGIRLGEFVGAIRRMALRFLLQGLGVLG